VSVSIMAWQKDGFSEVKDTVYSLAA